MPVTPLSYVIPTPIRSFPDPVTGAMIHQLTEGPEPSAHLYFTRCGWFCNGEYFLYVRRNKFALNYWVSDRTGKSRPVTDHQPPSDPESPTPHAHRHFISWEGHALMLRIPALHPTLPIFCYALNNRIHMVNVETGENTILHTFGSHDADQPRQGLHVQFTADGKHLIIVTNRLSTEGEPSLDPTDLAIDSRQLRDESKIISKIWRYNFESRQLEGVIFQSNGEQSHLLTCPWNPEVIFWSNYHHAIMYTINRDGTGLRKVIHKPGFMLGHYNWDVAHRNIVLQVSNVEGWHTDNATLDLETGNIHSFKSGSGKYQWHMNASPDGRWIVIDDCGRLIEGKNGLWLIDQENDTLHPLCQIECTWGTVSKCGKPVKSEFLHPNPSWSPEGRHIIFSSDFGRGLDGVQMYAVELPPA